MERLDVCEKFALDKFALIRNTNKYKTNTLFYSIGEVVNMSIECILGDSPVFSFLSNQNNQNIPSYSFKQT